MSTDPHERSPPTFDRPIKGSTVYAWKAQHRVTEVKKKSNMSSCFRSTIPSWMAYCRIFTKLHLNYCIWTKPSASADLVCRVDESWGEGRQKDSRRKICNHPHFFERQVRINMKYSIRFGTKIHKFWRVCAWLVLMMLMMMMMRMTLKRLMPTMTTTLEVRINMKYIIRFGTKKKYIFWRVFAWLVLN